MLVKIIQPEIIELIEKRDFATLKEVVADWQPVEIADLIVDLPTVQDQIILLRLLPQATSAAVFEYLALDIQKSLLKSLGNQDVATILNGMSPDDRTALLEELPAKMTKLALSLLSTEERQVAVSLLGYPEHSVGRLMTPEFIATTPSWTVQQVLDFVRENGKDSETLNVLYVVDEKGRLIDDIRIREFLVAPLNHLVRDLMDDSFVHLLVDDDREKALGVFKKYDRTVLPVTDNGGILIGIVTVDDMLDVAEKEATEDIQKIGAVESLDEPYSTIPLLSMIKKRAGWLSILFIGEMFTASAMGFFEHQINKAVVLALFVPLIISSGGNSGSQASTLVIRALSLGEIKLKDWFFVVRREFSSGLILGCILATLGFLRILIWQSISNIYGDHWLLVAVTVGFSLIGVVMWGTLMGAVLPLILRRLGFDPATSSAPFVATLVDVTGLIIYFTVAILVMRGTLL